MPCLGGNATELQLNVILELAGTRMSELAPGANREGEPRGVDEVVTVQATHGGSGVEENQEILRVMGMDREITIRKLEGTDEQVRDLGGKHLRPVAGDGGHHRAR